MTRQERLEHLAFTLGGAETMAYDAARHFPFDVSVDEFSCAASYANKALDHLAALEQSAITAYLAEVPLPEGWREQHDRCGGDVWPVVRFWEKVDGLPDTERVFADRTGTHIVTVPAHWPAIPLPVLLRAAVQCHRLREGK